MPESTTATNTPAAPALTLEQAARAFRSWNADHRANPKDFLSEAECAALEIGDLSERQAAHLLLLLRVAA